MGAFGLPGNQLLLVLSVRGLIASQPLKMPAGSCARVERNDGFRLLGFGIKRQSFFVIAGQRNFPRVTLVRTIPHWLLMSFPGCSGSSWIFLSFEHMTNTGGSGADLLRFGVPTGHSLNFGTKLTPSFFRPIWPDRNPPCGFCSSSTLAWVANEPERRKKPNN